MARTNKDNVVVPGTELEKLLLMSNELVILSLRIISYNFIVIRPTVNLKSFDPKDFTYAREIRRNIVTASPDGTDCTTQGKIGKKKFQIILPAFDFVSFLCFILIIS